MPCTASYYLYWINIPDVTFSFLTFQQYRYSFVYVTPHSVTFDEIISNNHQTQCSMLYIGSAFTKNYFLPSTTAF